MEERVVQVALELRVAMRDQRREPAVVQTAAVQPEPRPEYRVQPVFPEQAAFSGAAVRRADRVLEEHQTARGLADTRPAVRELGELQQAGRA
jgi:hypothetical protein